MRGKRLLSVALAATMLMSMVPMKAAAADATVVTTTVTETDTTKTIVYGPETLEKLAGKYGAIGNGEIAEHEAYPENDAENISARLTYKFVGSHTWGSNSGAAQLFLTKDNGENLVSVQADMARYTGGGHIAFGFGKELDSNNAGILNGKYFGQVGNWSNVKWIVRDLLTAGDSHAGNGDIAWIILGMAGGQDIGYAFSSVTATYNKSDADYALETAIEEAEALTDADEAVKSALAAAKLYVEDAETVALASQAEIEAATKMLTDAINQEDVDPVVKTALEKVNEAEDAAALKEVIEANAVELNIDLDTYNDLTDEQKAEVIATVLEKKPENGYANNDAVKAVFDTAVETQTTVTPEPTVKVQETTATEDEDTKTIIYAPTALDKMTKVNAKVVEDTEDEFDVMELSAWTDWGDNYGVCRIILTEDNASNLTSVTTNAKVSYDGTHFGMIVYTPSTETDTDEEGNETTTDTTVITRASQHWVSLQEWQEYNLLSQSYDAKTASIYFGLSNCKAGIWLKNVTAVYRKSDIDKALDAAIAEAEVIENPTDGLTAALNTAKQYKISTTTNIETAVLATQAEIEEAANALATEIEKAGGEVENPDPVIPEYKLGDVNSDDIIDLTDALYALQIALNIVEVDVDSSEYLAANVVADDNIVDIKDALAILKKANGKTVEGLEWYTAE